MEEVGGERRADDKVIGIGIKEFRNYNLNPRFFLIFKLVLLFKRVSIIMF